MIADAKVIAFLIKLSIFLLVKVHHTNLCETKTVLKSMLDIHHILDLRRYQDLALGSYTTDHINEVEMIGTILNRKCKHHTFTYLRRIMSNVN